MPTKPKKPEWEVMKPLMTPFLPLTDRQYNGRFLTLCGQYNGRVSIFLSVYHALAPQLLAPPSELVDRVTRAAQALALGMAAPVRKLGDFGAVNTLTQDINTAFQAENENDESLKTEQQQALYLLITELEIQQQRHGGTKKAQSVLAAIEAEMPEPNNVNYTRLQKAVNAIELTPQRVARLQKQADELQNFILTGEGRENVLSAWKRISPVHLPSFCIIAVMLHAQLRAKTRCPNNWANAVPCLIFEGIQLSLQAFISPSAFFTNADSTSKALAGKKHVSEETAVPGEKNSCSEFSTTALQSLRAGTIKYAGPPLAALLPAVIYTALIGLKIDYTSLDTPLPPIEIPSTGLTIDPCLLIALATWVATESTVTDAYQAMYAQCAGTSIAEQKAAHWNQRLRRMKLKPTEMLLGILGALINPLFIPLITLAAMAGLIKRCAVACGSKKEENRGTMVLYGPGETTRQLSERLLPKSDPAAILRAGDLESGEPHKKTKEDDQATDPRAVAAAVTAAATATKQPGGPSRGSVN
jgi:hypothetical protein